MECSSIEGDTGVARELGGVEPHKQSSKKESDLHFARQSGIVRTIS